MRIYAADDENLALELLKEAIMEAMPGENPVCFRTSQGLLDAAMEEVPDIVFLDINMPGMNGIEVASALNKIADSIKIIFVTGYSEYASQAFDVYAFGYLMKPCRAKHIRTLVDKIRIPLPPETDIIIKTFGNFEIFYKDKPVPFRTKMGKEMLAYLIDREGAKISRQEVAGILYGDDFSRSVQVSLSKIANTLAADLEKAGIADFFCKDGGYYVDMSKAECDFVEYLKGNPKYTFTGEYMEQYSWGEDRKASFS